MVRSLRIEDEPPVLQHLPTTRPWDKSHYGNRLDISHITTNIEEAYIYSTPISPDALCEATKEHAAGRTTLQR